MLRISQRQLMGALLLCGSSFVFGFVVSRFMIDVSLRQADAVLLRCTQDLERQQRTMISQFGADYEVLQLEVSAVKPGKGKQP